MSVEDDSLQTRRALLQTGFSSGDLDTLGRLVIDDVVWSAAGQLPWVGRTEVLTHLGGFFERFDYEFRLQDVGLDSDGFRAVERSNFTIPSGDRDESGRRFTFGLGRDHLGSRSGVESGGLF